MSAWRTVNSPLAPNIETIREEPIAPSPVVRLSTTLDTMSTKHSAHPATSAAQYVQSNHSDDSYEMPPSSPRSNAAPSGDTSHDSDTHKTKVSSATPLKPPSSEAMDIDMDDNSGGEAGDTCEGGDEGHASDNDSLNADGTKSGKKKKSQKFYCTDYPPCQLSFTRSEHLARHIRKHTGERPFQCHCSRRFSRLDNLRQHAQTVHVNEEIPLDSLAATGSRFQRQIRTERARQAGNRARASTGGSAGGPQRGHSKSLSTSNISSLGGTMGSAFTATTDPRRRPPPLIMADSREDSWSSHRPTDLLYQPPSPSDLSTPTSATFSTGRASPRWASGLASPASSHSRSHSMYSTRYPDPARRLSAPFTSDLYQSSQGHLSSRPIFSGAGHINGSNNSVFSPSSSSFSVSPALSNMEWSNRRGIDDDVWRRRTWHPESHEPHSVNPPPNILNISSQFVTPNPPPPMANPSTTKSTLQLPGIESFDLSARDASRTPPCAQSSAMVVESQSGPRPPVLSTTTRDHEERRNLNVYDANIQRGLNRLDINHSTPGRDNVGTWAPESGRAMPATHFEDHHSGASIKPYPISTQNPPYNQSGYPSYDYGVSSHQHTMSAPSNSTSGANKRRGWYNGPLSPHREESLVPHKDPRSARVDRMIHPNFNDFSGFPNSESSQGGQAQHHHHQEQQHNQEDQGQQSQDANPLKRLEALVAVAINEGSTAAAY